MLPVEESVPVGEGDLLLEQWRQHVVLERVSSGLCQSRRDDKCRWERSCHVCECGSCGYSTTGGRVFGR